MVSLRSIEGLPEDIRGHASVAIGNLDGVHLGHRALLAKAIDSARARAGKACVLTFSPHPQEVLHPGESSLRLTTDEEKKKLIEELGIDALVFLPFDNALAEQSAEAFFESVLHRGFQAASIHVGEDFRFGAKRLGDTALLKTLGAAAGIEVDTLAAVEQNGARISSTRIRQALQQGNVREAGFLLGRPYALSATVVRGAGRGSGLGFPTANLDYPVEKAVPCNGVYACRVLKEGKSFGAVANLGMRPTFAGATSNRPVLEAHLLDFHGSLYGTQVEIEFVDRLREEKRFANVQALQAQIAQDVAHVKSLYAEESWPFMF
ncbi:bifunctional riboflavin kinase/FAD synthetase [bacterium]|nr:bifunctional riboflavin kinase/FAD synthetase [bacterium]